MISSNLWDDLAAIQRKQYAVRSGLPADPLAAMTRMRIWCDGVPVYDSKVAAKPTSASKPPISGLLTEHPARHGLGFNGKA